MERNALFSSQASFMVVKLNTTPEKLQWSKVQALKRQFCTRVPSQRGELVDATVVRMTDDVVLLNYGSKEEASVPASEFMTVKGLITVKPGDSVRLQMTGYDDDGTPEFSYRKARQADALAMLAQRRAEVERLQRQLATGEGH